MMVESIEDSCGRFSAYSLKYVALLSHMCDNHPEKVSTTLDMVEQFCHAY